MKKITILFLTLIMFYLILCNLSTGMDKSISNQDTMLCESAKNSGNGDYLNKCECYYQSGDIDCLKLNFESRKEEKKPEKVENWIKAEFSAYNPTVGQCDDDPLIMASGKKVYDGAVACPTKYDFGTKIEIEGFGIYTCEDRMAKRYRDGEFFDVLIFDKETAITFGRKQLAYKLLNE